MTTFEIRMQFLFVFTFKIVNKNKIFKPNTKNFLLYRYIRFLLLNNSKLYNYFNKKEKDLFFIKLSPNSETIHKTIKFIFILNFKKKKHL